LEEFTGQNPSLVLLVHEKLFRDAFPWVFRDCHLYVAAIVRELDVRPEILAMLAPDAETVE
jgi:hypothetical protein